MPIQPDQQPGLMKGRHDPAQGIANKDKLTWLGALQDFLGQAWLSDPVNQSNPLVQLWDRLDWAASCELLTFGRALAGIRGASSKFWLEDHARRMRGHDLSGARGSAFEILLASMFATEQQQVHLPPPSEPGYDLTVAVPSGKRLRVSCKALAPSQYDSLLRSSARQAFASLRESLLPGSALHLAMQSSEGKATLPAASQLVNFARGYQTLNCRGVSTMSAGAWNVTAFPLRRLHNAQFSTERVSLGVSVFVHSHDDRQKRFCDKIDEACANLSEHFPSASSDEGAIVAMRVPEEISMAMAVAYTRESGLDRHPSICGVFLFRTQVCANGVDIALGHEFKIVTNPGAQFPLTDYAPSNTLAASMLFGYVLGAIPFDAPTLPPYVSPIPSASHAFERQHHHYVTHYGGSQIQVEPPPHQLGLSCDWTFLGRKRIDVKHMSCVPDRDLTLL
ncbi:MAG: hypothetical protein ABUL62_11550 [Myxococcales bacterium]